MPRRRSSRKKANRKRTKKSSRKVRKRSKKSSRKVRKRSKKSSRKVRKRSKKRSSNVRKRKSKKKLYLDMSVSNPSKDEYRFTTIKPKNYDEQNKTTKQSGGMNGGSLSDFNSIAQTFALYHSAGCPHCINFLPTWKSFVSQYNGNYNGIRFLDFESSAVPDVFSLNDSNPFSEIQGVPTLRYYPMGLKNYTNFKVFEGDRDINSLVKFLSMQMK